MHELNLQEIKSMSLEILRYFKKICNENNIKYYLSNGTLLGAVKYNGFIPWDDDIDVLVPREDYERLIRIFVDDERYKLFSVERNPKFKYTFAKLCDMSTRKCEENIDNGIELGVDVDIFPLDSCTSHIFKRSVLNKILLYQKACILSKFSSSSGKPFYKRCIIECCRYKGYDFFSKKFSRIILNERKSEGNYKGCLLWPIYGKKEIVPADVFGDTIEVEFEGEMFSAPIGYDVYLQSLYGDYEKDPPIDKQKTHHKFRAYKI